MSKGLGQSPGNEVIPRLGTSACLPCSYCHLVQMVTQEGGPWDGMKNVMVNPTLNPHTLSLQLIGDDHVLLLYFSLWLFFCILIFLLWGFLKINFSLMLQYENDNVCAHAHVHNVVIPLSLFFYYSPSCYSTSVPLASGDECVAQEFPYKWFLILAERDLLSTAPRMKIFKNKITLNYHQQIQTLFIEIEEVCYNFCYYLLPPQLKKKNYWILLVFWN